MKELYDVTNISYIEGYKYQIEFEDGLVGVVDFTNYLDNGPVFEPLKNVRIFKTAVVDGGTISWPNGADIAPETLYDRIADQGHKRQSRGKTKNGRVPRERAANGMRAKSAA